MPLLLEILWEYFHDPKITHKTDVIICWMTKHQNRISTWHVLSTQTPVLSKTWTDSGYRILYYIQDYVHIWHIFTNTINIFQQVSINDKIIWKKTNWKGVWIKANSGREVIVWSLWNCHLRNTNFNNFFTTNLYSISTDDIYRYDEKSTLVQVMAWRHHQAMWNRSQDYV